MTASNSRKRSKGTQIAFFPDRLAHYRLPVFRQLSNENANATITFYSSKKKSISSINLINHESNEIKVTNINEMVFRNKVFWQSKIISQSLSPQTDTIVCWGEMHRISTWIASLIARILRKPFFMWTHGLYGNEGTFKRIIRTTFYRTALGLFLYGNHSKNLLQKSGFDPKNLEVIYNSLDLKTQREIANNKKHEDLLKTRDSIFQNLDDEKILIFCSRLVPKKDPIILLKALALANKESCSFKLIIVGDGPHKSKIQETIRKLNIEDSVHLFGACYHEEELCTLFMISDMCVSPGNVGLTALHSLAYGTPVATHSDINNQMPEAETVVPGKSGILFEKDNEADIVDQLKHWFSRPPSRSEVLEYAKSNIFNKYNTDYQTSVFYNMLKRSSDQYNHVI